VSEISRLPFIHVTIPALDEGDFLWTTLQCLENQSYSDFRVYICINQPDSWWLDPGKREICQRNMDTLTKLRTGLPFDSVIIDRTSPGSGWQGKQKGVGWARKTAMDLAFHQASASDIMVSLDADTIFNEDYLLSVALGFAQHPEAVAMAVPYFHRLTGDQKLDRAMLRYEIYMRHYLLNLMRIGSPYAFTALGSAIALPVISYGAIRGITPRNSGEDFYFLQKLRKFGKVITWSDEKVYPGTRYSDRVGFGTGPALIKGAEGDWGSYPIYPLQLFNEIWETYELFPLLYTSTVETPLTGFLASIFKETDPWQPLRVNAVSSGQFIRSCHEKLDGLRVLQFLKTMNHDLSTLSDEDNLKEYLFATFPPEEIRNIKVQWEKFSFMESSLDQLEEVRMFLSGKEDEYRFIEALL